METQSFPELEHEKRMERVKVHPFLELLGAGCPPPVSDHKSTPTLTLLADSPMGLTPEPAELWLSGSKSVLLWIELDFIDFPVGDL